MRVLIIGGTRFIGPEVVRQLHALGHQVTVFHRGQTPQSSHQVSSIFLETGSTSTIFWMRSKIHPRMWFWI